ncbi:unnamed protein product [Prorocentrum cordatum]|uniref:Uncharacterized protein n=1 Tax=Prorocentrum cordatum TaxID=2364126 RepID=A0ABN9XWB5_9DINO|nr:unnamed protein product [Polarella glacialis]
MAHLDRHVYRGPQLAQRPCHQLAVAAAGPLGRSTGGEFDPDSPGACIQRSRAAAAAPVKPAPVRLGHGGRQSRQQDAAGGAAALGAPPPQGLGSPAPRGRPERPPSLTPPRRRARASARTPEPGLRQHVADGSGTSCVSLLSAAGGRGFSCFIFSWPRAIGPWPHHSIQISSLRGDGPSCICFCELGLNSPSLRTRAVLVMVV